jgi:hypothetical protein
MTALLDGKENFTAKTKAIAALALSPARFTHLHSGCKIMLKQIPEDKEVVHVGIPLE